jgi:hypothetical protein
MSSTKALVAVAHRSDYGHAATHAKAVGLEASSFSNANSLLIPVEDLDLHRHTLENSAAIVSGWPPYVGSAAGQFKVA